MKMYSYQLSNFAGKCRVAAYEKGLNIEFLDPREDPGQKEYRKINPTGKGPGPGNRRRTAHCRVGSH